MPLMKSFVQSANSALADFPLNNLPYGVFSIGEQGARCGVAIGDVILDVAALERQGLLMASGAPVFDVPGGTSTWRLAPALGQSFAPL